MSIVMSTRLARVVDFVGVVAIALWNEAQNEQILLLSCRQNDN